MNLNGRTALVTGGTQGVGAAIAISLAKAGANLVLHGLHEDPSAIATIDACLAHGVRVTPLYCDLTQSIAILQRDTAAVLRGDVTHERQPQATAAILGTHIGFEHFRAHTVRQSRPDE